MRRQPTWKTEEKLGIKCHLLDYGNPIWDRVFLHGVFTRQGGLSAEPWDSLNVGHSVGDAPQAVEANYALICQTMGVSRETITSAEQVHGAEWALATLEHRGRVFAATDGLITDTPGVPLMLRFADCVPILLFDPERPAVGLIHAGWRGTLGGIAARTVMAMRDAFGSRPEALIAGIGPSIGPCCYRIGGELADEVQARFPQWPELMRWEGDSPYLDLWLANQRQLEAVGVCSVASAQLCTACHVDQFFSHRAERGRTGRFAAVIGLRRT